MKYCYESLLRISIDVKHENSCLQQMYQSHVNVFSFVTQCSIAVRGRISRLIPRYGVALSLPLAPEPCQKPVDVQILVSEDIPAHLLLVHGTIDQKTIYMLVTFTLISS